MPSSWVLLISHLCTLASLHEKAFLVLERANCDFSVQLSQTLHGSCYVLGWKGSWCSQSKAVGGGSAQHPDPDGSLKKMACLHWLIILESLLSMP